MLSWQCEVHGVGLHQYTLPLPRRMEGEGEDEGGGEAGRQTVHLGLGAKTGLLGNNERSCMRLI